MSFKLSLVIVSALLVASASCGTVDRIVGGEDASPDQFPYQIALFRNGGFTCGGSVIASKFILTAAHCVVQDGITPYPASTFSIRAGSINRSSGGVLVQVKAITVNEQYGNFLYDVAVLELVSSLTYSAKIQPIELSNSEVPVGANVVISGWGRLSTNGVIPTDLQYNTLEAISKTKCLTAIGMYSDTLLCLAHKANNGACNGDSGGPAVYDGKLVGVAGFVVSGCGSSNPDGYAKVSYHNQWIKNLIA